MSGPDVSLLRVRSAALVAAVAALLSSVGATAARAESPAPSGSTATVSAVVLTDDGPEVIKRKVASQDVAEVTDDLEGRRGVVTVGLDVPVKAMGTADPYRSEQWSLGAFGMDRLPADTPDGSGLIVAVLDTGVLVAHPDLAGRVRCDLGADFTADAATYDPAGNGCVDPHGHGTHVAGQIAALTDNGIGIAGLSGAAIMPVRVLGASGSGSSSAIAAGIYHAVDHGASVINMSLGGPYTTSYDDAVKYAVDRGVVVVASAGNNRQAGNTVNYPAASPGALSIAATEQTGRSAPFNYSGKTVFISAPGTNVLSTSAGGGYASMSGTSMAAPNASGIIVRYRAAHPTATPGQIRTMIQYTAIDIETAGPDNNTGYGLLDAYELLTDHEAPRAVPDTPSFASLTPGSLSVRVEITPPADTGGLSLTGYTVKAYRAGTLVKTFSVAPGVTTLNVTGLSNDVAYTFTVSAKNALGESRTSSTSTPVTPSAVPRAPRLGVSTPGNTTVTVRWTAPIGTLASPISGYTVKAYQGAALQQTVQTAPSTLSADFAGLTNGVGYTFTVGTTNAIGTSTLVRTPVVVPRTAPGTPVLDAPTAGIGTAAVRWTAPTTTGGAAINGYVVRLYRDGELAKTIPVGSSARTYTATGLTNGVEHTFTVTAKNIAGMGPESAPSAVVVPRTRPGAPVIGVPTAGSTSATVNWTAAASDGGLPITAYTVRVYKGSSLAQTLTAPGDSTSLAVTGLVNGASYTFTVTATNVAGTGTASARSVAVVPR